jgi:hypothetical protein
MVVPLVRNVTLASASSNVATRVSLNASVGTAGISSARRIDPGSTPRAREARIPGDVLCLKTREVTRERIEVGRVRPVLEGVDEGSGARMKG